MSFHTQEGWCQCRGEKQQREGGEQGETEDWSAPWRGWGGASGGQVGHNARLFVIGLIFITLNIKEPEGKQFVRVTEFNSNKSIHASLQREPEEMNRPWLI